jgi:hypothetical protein
MRALTLLFYAVATFCLGSLTIFTGGSRILAQLFGADQVVQNGFATYPTEPWQSILLYGTVGLSLVFLVFAIYFALAPGLPRPSYDDDVESGDPGDAEVPRGR